MPPPSWCQHMSNPLTERLQPVYLTKLGETVLFKTGLFTELWWKRKNLYHCFLPKWLSWYHFQRMTENPTDEWRTIILAQRHRARQWKRRTLLISKGADYCVVCSLLLSSLLVIVDNLRFASEFNITLVSPKTSVPQLLILCFFISSW